MDHASIFRATTAFAKGHEVALPCLMPHVYVAVI